MKIKIKTIYEGVEGYSSKASSFLLSLRISSPDASSKTVDLVPSSGWCCTNHRVPPRGPILAKYSQLVLRLDDFITPHWANIVGGPCLREDWFDFLSLSPSPFPSPSPSPPPPLIPHGRFPSRSSSSLRPSALFRFCFGRARCTR